MNDVWYVAADSKGFTRRVEDAKKDKNGNPINEAAEYREKHG